MKRSILLLSTLLLLQSNLSLAVKADPITFKPSTDSAPASLQGHLPLNKVGSLLAADTLAILNGNEITIQSSHTPDPQKPDLFKGQILKSKIETVGDAKNLSGIAYFNGGTRLDKLSHTQCDESVTLTDGQTLKGIIESADKMQLALKTSGALQTIKMADVSAIHSPRAFNFSMPVPKGTDTGNPAGFNAEMGRMTLNPTCHVLSGGATTSSTKKKVIIIAVGVTLIATAIAVPIAVGCATHHHHHNPQQFQPIQQPQTALQVTPVTPIVGRVVTVGGTKLATAAVPPTYQTVITRVFVPGTRSPFTRGHFIDVITQKFVGFF